VGLEVHRCLFTPLSHGQSEAEVLGDAARAQSAIPHFILPFVLMVVLESSKAAIKIMSSFRSADHHPLRIGDEREWLKTASSVMANSWGLSFGLGWKLR
jgi:hypothetical protein